MYCSLREILDFIRKWGNFENCYKILKSTELDSIKAT